MVPSSSRPPLVGAGSEPAPTEPAPTEPAPTEPAPTEPAPTEPGFTEPASRDPSLRNLSSVRSHQGDMAETQKDYGWCRDFSASSLGGAMCGVSSLWRLDKEVEGALIPDSMQRVSKCKWVGFCGAAARRRGGQNITLSIQKVFDCKGYESGLGWKA